MKYNSANPKDKDFYKDLEEINNNLYTESGLVDNLFLDLCRAKIDTNILGRLINIPVIVPDKEGTNQVTVNKYFEYAIKNTTGILIGKPKPPFIIGLC
jgi:hypothetical protein